MFMNYIALLLLLVYGCINRGIAEEITIGVEPFPPFVDSSGEGLTIDLLREIEKITALSFEVKVMTYARAKHELKVNRLDIAGHTPKDLESDDFYQYALELDWSFDTTSDFFTLNTKFLEVSNILPGRIGTTRGNAVYLAEMVGLTKEHFVEIGTLPRLVDMLISGRIDVIFFERASVMSLLQQRQIQNVYYQSAAHIPASIAVANNEQGKALKEKMDKAINKINIDRIFASYLKYYRLPDKGIMPITIE